MFHDIQKKGAFYVIASGILFSSKVVIGKWLYQYHISPLHLLSMRMIFAFPFYLAIAAKYHNSHSIRVSRVDVKTFFILALLGYFVSSLLDFTGFQYISSSLERMLLYLYPAFVLIFSSFINKKRIPYKLWIYLTIIYSGVILMYFTDTDSKNIYALKGVFMVMGSAISFSLFLVFGQKINQKYGSLKFTSYTMMISTLYYMIYLIIHGDLNLTGYPTQVYYATMGIAVFCTVIPSLMMNAGMKILGPEKTAMMGAVGPISTLILGVLVLNESIDLFEFMGMTLILIGVYFTNKIKRV